MKREHILLSCICDEESKFNSYLPLVHLTLISYNSIFMIKQTWALSRMAVEPAFSALGIARWVSISSIYILV